MDSDLVVIDMVFADETWEISPCLTRAQARRVLYAFGPPLEILWDNRKRVVWAQIRDYTPTLLDLNLAVH